MLWTPNIWRLSLVCGVQGSRFFSCGPRVSVSRGLTVAVPVYALFHLELGRPRSARTSERRADVDFLHRSSAHKYTGACIALHSLPHTRERTNLSFSYSGKPGWRRRFRAGAA